MNQTQNKVYSEVSYLASDDTQLSSMSMFTPLEYDDCWYGSFALHGKNTESGKTERCDFQITADEEKLTVTLADVSKKVLKPYHKEFLKRIPIPTKEEVTDRPTPITYLLMTALTVVFASRFDVRNELPVPCENLVMNFIDLYLQIKNNDCEQIKFEAFSKQAKIIESINVDFYFMKDSNDTLIQEIRDVLFGSVKKPKLAAA